MEGRNFKMFVAIIGEVINDFFSAVGYESLGKFLIVVAVIMLLEVPIAQWRRMGMRRAKYVYRPSIQ